MVNGTLQGDRPKKTDFMVGIDTFNLEDALSKIRKPRKDKGESK